MEVQRDEGVISNSKDEIARAPDPPPVRPSSIDRRRRCHLARRGPPSRRTLLPGARGRRPIPGLDADRVGDGRNVIGGGEGVRRATDGAATAFGEGRPRRTVADPPTIGVDAIAAKDMDPIPAVGGVFRPATPRSRWKGTGTMDQRPVS